MSELIEISQDHEVEEGELMGPVPIFWARGHGHDPSEFIHAVVAYCLDNDVDIPRIEPDNRPEETWQQNVNRHDSIEYRRDPTPPTSQRTPRFPITLLDLTGHRGRGATKCSIRDCGQPWRAGCSVQVVVDMDEEATSARPYTSVELWLCREHNQKLPDPWYRMTLVPVGATIMLPSGDGEAAKA